MPEVSNEITLANFGSDGYKNSIRKFGRVSMGAAEAIWWDGANGYDGWLMLNVYPQRATNPKEMHMEVNTEMHRENIEQILQIVKEQKHFDVCAAWGTEIDRRSYLQDCLKDIVEAIDYVKNWIYLNE